MNHILTKSMKSQQFKLLSSNLGLYQLFNKVQMRPIFNIPEHSIVVNIDNITFGPDKYSIIVKELDDIYYKAIYYAILYFTFEKNTDNKGFKIYQKLLEYALKNMAAIDLPELSLSEQQVKVYIFKFLNILASGQKKKKVVLEELNSLPQINLILTELFKDICEYQDINIDNNSREIQLNLLNKLGIKVQLLSYEMFIIQDEFILQMRQFNQYFEFSVVTQKKQNVQKIRQEFLMAQSACFNIQMSSSNMLKDNKKSNIVRKSTLKSVEWVDQEDDHGHGDAENDPRVQSKDLINTLTSVTTLKRTNDCIKQTLKESTEDQFDTPFKKIDKVPNIKEFLSGEMNNSSIMFNMNDDKVCEASPTTESDSNQFKFVTQKTIKYHKPTVQLKNPFISRECLYQLKNSYSTKCIKSDGFASKSQKTKRQEIRIPKFIQQKMKLKQLSPRANLPQKLNKSVHEINLGQNSPFECQKKTIRITFTYLS